MDQPSFPSSRSRQLLAGGSILLALGLFSEWQGWPAWQSHKSFGESCQAIVQSQTTLSRQQLAKLLTVPEGGKKTQIREIVKEPYCQLADLQVRAGATAQREAYPLEFEPQTWLVLLYEGEQYAGYRFALR